MKSSKSAQINTQKPIYWKQVLVTTLSVYPLILMTSWALKFILPMQLLKPEVATFFTVIVVVSLLVFPVMPFMAKVAGPWMHRK